MGGDFTVTIVLGGLFEEFDRLVEVAGDALAPEVYYDGKRLPRYDAVIPRIGATVTSYGTAVLRQFETLGTYCVNGSAGITASRDKLHAHQVLAAQR